MFPGLGYITPIPASVCTLPLSLCFKETLRAFPVAETIKNLPAMQETQVQSLGWEDPLEKEMATHSSILAWRIPRTEEPGELLSMGFPRREYWSGQPFPSPGDLPNPGIQPGSPALQVDFLWSQPLGKP